MEEFSIGEPDKTVKVGSHLDPITKKKLVFFLQKNSNVFAWSQEDKPGIAPLVMVHKLNADPSYKPVQRKRRGHSTKKSQAAAEEVKKLCEAGFILIFIQKVSAKSIQKG